MRPIYQNQKTNLHQFQKDCHQGNLPFGCLQDYKHNCLNMFSGIFFLHKQIMNYCKWCNEMIEKDSHSTPSSDTFKPRILV